MNKCHGFTRIVVIILFVLYPALSLAAKTFNVQGISPDINVSQDSSRGIKGTLVKGVTLKVNGNKYPLKAGGEIVISKNPLYISTAVLRKNTTVTIFGQKFRLMGGKNLSFFGKKSWRTGKLEIFQTSMYLQKDTTITAGKYRIKCKGGSARKYGADIIISKNMDGSFSIGSVILVGNQSLKIGGQVFEFLGGSELKFMDSYLYTGDLAKDIPVTIGGQKFIAGKKFNRHTKSISFHRDGNISFVFIRKRNGIKVGKRTLNMYKDTRVAFHRDGSLKRINWVHGGVRVDIPGSRYYLNASGAVYVEFYKSGAVKYLKQGFDVDTVIKTERGKVKVLLCSSHMQLYENEKIKFAKVCKPVKLSLGGKEIQVRLRQKIYLDEEGNLVKVR